MSLLVPTCDPCQARGAEPSKYQSTCPSSRCHHQGSVRRTFVEDYNTGTLPHKKYYDLAAYERKKTLKARGDDSEEVKKT